MRILAWAYEFAPGLGSEPGAGWVWARMLATLGETWVITSPHLRGEVPVEERLAALPEGDRIHVVYTDIPGWPRRLIGRHDKERWKRLEYVLWQIAALDVARRLEREHHFDLVWHLTWANVWIGSLASLVGPPLVFGPVGGGVDPPWRLVPAIGAHGAAGEVLRTVTRNLARRLNPLAHTTWDRSRLILVQNPETRAWLPQQHRSKTVLFPNVVLEESLPPRRPRPHDRSTALFVGRLLPLKGVALAIDAMSLLPEWDLLVCGAGPDEQRLRSLVRRAGLEGRVRFLGWQPRAEALRLMREEADVFLFPSLHDEGSWVVAEAVASGLPVVCLARGGPAVLAGTGVHVTTRDETVRRLAEAVRVAGSHHVSTPRTDLAASRVRLADVLRQTKLLYPAASATSRS